jgi:NAD(P)-dependent dehydrogenase (short-subunit alcohol dehydrogenase family)
MIKGDLLIFTDKIALVTGANKGIGFAIVTELALRGFTVYLGSRNLENGKNAASKLTGKVIPVQIDVTDIHSIQRAVEFVQQNHWIHIGAQL